MINYDSKNWLIEETKYQSDYLAKTESIFHLGNGYLGVRSSNEEPSSDKIRNMFLNGVFNKVDDDEVSELSNIPDILELRIKINDKFLKINESTVKEYNKTLDLKTATLYRKLLIESDGYIVQLNFTRFVSLKSKNLVAQKCEISINKDAEVQIFSGIDGQVSNSGCQHFNEGKKRMFDDVLQDIVTTNQSKIKVAVNTSIKFDCAVSEIIAMDRRKIFKRYDLKMSKDQVVYFEKLSFICSSLEKQHKKDISVSSLKEFQEIKKEKFEHLHLQNKKEWAEFWDASDIVVEGSEYGQVAIRFALFQLRCNTDYDDVNTNIGAKGLTGEGYKGHTFWDTEIFILPHYIYSKPKVAKKLLTYRYLGLKGARKKALENGYQGAMYPWESASSDLGEVTPVYGAADIVTGKSTKIESGFIEQHITSDVIYGLWLYYSMTNDEKFMESYGYEMVLDTAKFWSSRVKKTKRGYEIKDVIGPDEYKEHIDNNSFTNYMAKWNIDLALLYIEKGVVDSLVKSLKINVSLLKDVSKNIRLQKINEDGILPQDDTFLSLEKIDLSKYKSQKNVGLIFEDYNLKRVNNIQVSKQADVLVLFLLQEEMFTKKDKIKNFDFYESVTLHDSSLSLSTHSVLASDLGLNDLGYDLYKKCLDIDLGQNMKTSDHGIHTASLGGMWQCIVYGFGGVRYTTKGLKIEPKLPKEFTSLKFKIVYLSSELEITINKNDFSIFNKSTKDVEIFYKDELFKINANNKVEI